MSHYVPDVRLEPEEDVVFCECDECENEIYVGEVYYNIDDHKIHLFCLEEWFSQNAVIATKGDL